MALIDAERAYLAGRLIGRLATASTSGELQNNPVSFRYDEELGTIDIASYNPWHVRGVEIRGVAEAVSDVEPPGRGHSREITRIHPQRVFSWGLDQEGMQRRTLA